MNNVLTFNNFCEKCCDRMYEPRLPEEDQCTGYKELKRMVKEGIEPASLEEVKRWETNPTTEELLVEPDVRYLRFLHPLLRPLVIENWDLIKILPLN